MSTISDFSSLLNLRGGKRLRGGCSDNGAAVAAIVVVIVILFMVIIGAAVWGSGCADKEYYVVTSSGEVAKVRGMRASTARNRVFGGVRAATEVTTQAEVEKALNGEKPAVVFLYMNGCGYCTRTKPMYDELAQELRGVQMLKVNADHCRELCAKEGINGFPTFLTNFGYGPNEARGKYKKYVGAKATKADLKKMLLGYQADRKSRGVVSPMGGSRIVVSPVAVGEHDEDKKKPVTTPPRYGEARPASEAEVVAALRSAEPAAVFVHADWCGFCKKFDPVFSDAARAFPAIKMLKVDSAKAQQLVKEHGITGFPTILTNFGEKKHVGYLPAEGLAQLLNKAA